VAVLVESPEHARTLAGRLAGWRVVRHDPRPWRGGWGGWDPAAPLRDPAGFDGCALTTLAARRAEALDVDVLVRADGGVSPLRLPGFPAPGLEPYRSPVLVDVADDADAAAEEVTLNRVRAYQASGWTIEAAPWWATAD
jgi:hypothetical protein